MPRRSMTVETCMKGGTVAMSTVQISDAQIAEAAFLLWLDEGRPEGRHEDHWYRAMTALQAPAAPKARKTARKAAASTAKATAEAKPNSTRRPRTARAGTGKATKA